MSEKKALYASNDQWQILCEYADAATCRQWFTYGNYIDEVLSRNTSPTLMLVMQYYAHDHLYSPALIVSTGAAGGRCKIDEEKSN